METRKSLHTFDLALACMTMWDARNDVNTMNFTKLKKEICGEIESILVRRWGSGPLPPRQPQPRGVRGTLKSNPQFALSK